MDAIPINFQEVLKLPSLNINPQTISFTTVTMESDKFICVRDQLSQVKTISIVDIQNKNVSVNKINAESVVMNPKTKVLALRNKNVVEIYNLEMKALMKDYKNFTEDIVFWRWISASVLAIVTTSAVYHWSMDQSTPTLIFKRHENLASATIINYQTDKEFKWLLLVGLTKTEQGEMKGVLQLFSVDKNITQYIEGHCGVFIPFKLSNNYVTTCICIASNNGGDGKIFIMEVPTQKPADAPVFNKQNVKLQFSAPNDFPVAMQAGDKYGIIYMITKMGFLYLFDVETGKTIFKNKITQDTLFVTTKSDSNNGFLGINKSGQLLSISINEETIIPYITKVLNDQQLAISIAARANLSGADDLYVQQFNNLLTNNDIDNAIKLVLGSPSGILRTLQTLQRLQRVNPQLTGGKPALSLYFQIALESYTLNAIESVTLSQILLSKPGGIDKVKEFIKSNKMEPSESLGDLVQQQDPEFALQIYVKGKAHEKIVNTLVMKGDYEKIIAYCTKVEYTPNYLELFKRVLQANPAASAKFASKIYEKDSKLLDSNVLIDIYIQTNCFKDATSYLLEIMKEDKEEQGDLQTRLIEMNLIYSPVQVSDSILGQKLYSHFDKKKIAMLCEKAGLVQHALENYEDIIDIKRCIIQTNLIDPQWLLKFFGTKLDLDNGLVCFREILKANPKQNVAVAVQIASKFSEIFTPQKIIAIFEEFNSFEGLFYYLASIVDNSKDPDVHFKYIQSGVRTGNIAEVERITRESQFYDPQKTKDFLKECKLQDMTPFINVCDKYDMIEEMVTYLYKNQLLKYIDFYVKQRSPIKTPKVVGALLDVDASEDFIKGLILAVGNMCPVEPLVNEAEKRNRLKLLMSFLEARLNEGSQEPALHNAIAKIYVDLNKSPENFLKTNQFYSSKVVGEYCEKRNPTFAFIAYERGQCDEEIISLTNKNGMYKHQARYLIKRQNIELWAKVLIDSNQFRRQIIDQVVQTALPESQNPEEISTTVRAFMEADLPNELIELLEQIVLNGKGEFKKNKNLQNLLILTAIKADQSRVMDYISKLNDFDSFEIAKIALEKKLFEEAFAIYKKFKLNQQAITVLLKNIGSIERATEFAEAINEDECWSILGVAQLKAEMVKEAINSFMKAKDASQYHEVISVAEKTKNFEDLIVFLKMARIKTQDSTIDSELIYAFAHNAQMNPNSNGLADLEEFIASPNIANIQDVGDKCFDEGLYEAARILFTNISNFSRLASALVKLNRNRDAVNAATKANNIKTWKEVMCACVDAEQFNYAQACAINIIIHTDELDELINYYEVRGHPDEVIELLEKGTSLENAHIGIFTSLGCLYARYNPKKLMEHITRYWKRSNIQKLLITCEENELWAEMRALHVFNEEHDLAIKIMIENSAEAWDHNIFIDSIVKVVNMELYFKSIQFYLNEHPKQIIELLTVLTPKIDHARVGKEVKQSGHLSLIKDYLRNVQVNNIFEVNECLNSLYIEEEDYENLRMSVEKFDNFDFLLLAKQLKDHPLLEFRRISASLYKRKKQFDASIELSKKDKLYQDAMNTAADSQDYEVAEKLLRFFAEQGLKDCFAACSFNCYSFVHPDVALELAWRYKLIEMIMPYLVQILKEYSEKIDNLTDKDKEREEKEKEREEVEKKNNEIQQQIGGNNFMQPNNFMTPPNNNFMNPPNNFMMPPNNY